MKRWYVWAVLGLGILAGTWSERAQSGSGVDWFWLIAALVAASAASAFAKEIYRGIDRPSRVVQVVAVRDWTTDPVPLDIADYPARCICRGTWGPDGRPQFVTPPGARCSADHEVIK